MRGLKSLLAQVGFVGSFALAMFGHNTAAHADSSAPDSYVLAMEHNAASHIVLPRTVRAARTPSKPAPAITIKTTKGTLTYLKSKHRDPVMVFLIELSRAPGKNEVTVAYQTSGSNATANSEFDNVSGNAIFHGTSTKYKVLVPVIAPLGKDPSNYITLQLSNPFDGVITGGQGIAKLVSKGNVRK